MVNYKFNEPVRIADFFCKKYSEPVVKIEQFRLWLPGVIPALITGTVSGLGKKMSRMHRNFHFISLPAAANHWRQARLITDSGSPDLSPLRHRFFV